MIKKKISQLDLANASLSGYLPMSDSAGTVTNKITVQSLLSLGGGGGGNASFVTAAVPSGFPASGVSNNLYIATDSSKFYRWDSSNSVYVETGPVINTENTTSALSWSSIPSYTSASGTNGQIAYDENYIYIATASNTWKRAALTSWSNFTSTSVSGMQLWLDATDTTTLYDSVSGGSLVAADSTIARWMDKSGRDNHAIQATSSSRPIRRLTGLYNLPSVQFVADTADSGDWLRIPHTSSLNGASGLSIFMVYSTSSIGTNKGLAGKWNGPEENFGNSWVFGYIGSATGVTPPIHITNNGTDSSLVTGTTNFNDGAKRLLSFVSLSTGLSVRMNGISETTNSSASFGNPSSTADVVIGGYCGGSLSTGQRLMSSHIGEILIYSASLSPSDIQTIENYLMTKWSIS